jgi:ABC-type oligopeptide transport system substrate-binding subunit
VQAVDQGTLSVELEAPTSYFPLLLATATAFPVPRHVVDAHGEDWTRAENIVANGPFDLEVCQPGKSMTLTRNLHFRGPFAGNVQRVELFTGLDSPEAQSLYQSDGLDVLPLWLRPGPEMDRVRQRHADDYLSGPSLCTHYIGFDVSRPPFNDHRVRRAFVLATDKEALVNTVMGGYVFPATGGFVPPGLPGHSPEIGLPYHPDQARQLLAQAGYPQGRGFPAVEGLTILGTEPMVAYLTAQWYENLGVNVTWQTINVATMISRVNKAPPQILRNAWFADYPDPDNFLRTAWIRRQVRWQNTAYESLVAQAQRATDQGERIDLYRHADKILIEEAAIMPYLYEREHLLVKPWVSRYPMSPMNQWFWKDVIIEPH